MSSMKGFRDYQKRKRLKEKQKQKSLPNSCNKQYPDCPEKPNKNDCKTCPFYKEGMEEFDEVTGREILKNPLNKKDLSDKELDDIML